ncbi:MAG: DNA-binding protein [Candidatus Aenigmarchaeota archaeon]|nr:DNA-binding protein [Candidatus Aenigmarchaeota archaeon]
MKISELTSGQNNVNLQATVSSVSEPRSVNTKFGSQTTLTEATLDDGSGKTIKLTLWGNQAEGISEGKKVEIAGGFTKEFKGELQLGVGKQGKLTVL